MTENDEIFTFGVSTEEDLRFRLTFTNRSFTGRTLAINIRERETNVLKTTLTAPSRITVVNSGALPGIPSPPPDNDVTASLPKAMMAGWATGQYEADLLDLTTGSATRIAPVRFQFDIPGKLVYGVDGSQATITITDGNKALVTAVGGVGLPGPATTLEAGTITMLPPGSTPIFDLTDPVGDPPTQTLSFSLPVGDTGDQGIAGQIISVSAVSSAPGTSPDVENLGTPEQAELLFTIPTGDQGDHGWSPVLATASDGARRVLQVVDWTGGEGTKPTLTGYVGAGGIVASIGDGIDIRGAPGASVGPGAIDTPELADGAVTEPKVDADFLATILRTDDLPELVPQTGPTGAGVMPTGNTGQRPVSPAAGYFRFNSLIGKFEGFDGTVWGAVGGGASILDTAPVNPTAGQLWWESDTGALYVYYDDGNSQQWVQVNAASTLGEAPIDGKAYMRRNGVWTPYTAARNRIVNGAMQISQELGNTAGVASGNVSYYHVDQWIADAFVSPGTMSVQRVQSATPGGSKDRLRLTVVAAKTTLGAGDRLFFQQNIEGIRVADFRWGSASARQVVLRFGFKAPAGTYSICFFNDAANRTYIASFVVSAGQANTDTVQSFVIPGDTTGVWLGDTGRGMGVIVTLATGTTYQGATGWQSGFVLGTASNTNGMATVGNVFELFDVGLYLDADNTGIAPRWEMPDEAEELQACKRYWQKVDTFWSGYATSGSTFYDTRSTQRSMRVPPACSGVSVASGGFPTSGSLGALNDHAVQESRTSNSTLAGGNFGSVVTCNARM